jgi:photosystem II stability/assembly factor-like uncharacterized protein
MTWITRFGISRLGAAGAVAALALTAAALPASATAGADHRPAPPTWRLLNTDGVTSLRGLAVAGPRTAWAGGTDGTNGVVLRTTDGGAHWASVGPAGATGLDFRDVEAFDADNAVALSAGPGPASAIYVTSDGGRHWTLGFRNGDANAFYDCAAFYDRRHGLAVSDPPDGRFRILRTDDGGHHWRVLPNAGMPAAQPGEAGFAGSGTCLVTAGPVAYLASGGGAKARVYRSPDGGYHWTSTDTAVPSSPSAGIFSLAFRDPRHGVAVGGDYLAPTASPDAAARTADAGRSWSGAAGTGQYRSGAAWRDGHTVLAVGTSGSDVSYDAGGSWTTFDTGAFNVVRCGWGRCWAAGPKGRLAVLA